jgi:hypothetical protein
MSQSNDAGAAPQNPNTSVITTLTVLTSSLVSAVVHKCQVSIPVPFPYRYSAVEVAGAIVGKPIIRQ